MKAQNNFQRKPSEITFNHLVNFLKTFMVHHMKSQQINGSEALALPPTMTSIIMLTMSRDEDKAFNYMNWKHSTLLKHSRNDAKSFTAKRMFIQWKKTVLDFMQPKELMEPIRYSIGGMQRCCYNPESLTKIVALRKDLPE